MNRLLPTYRSLCFVLCVFAPSAWAADDEGFVTVDELRKLFTYQTAEQTDALSEKEFSEFCNMFGIGGASSRIPLDVIKRHPCWEEAKVEM